MPLDFPSNPTNGQTYDNYYYDATVGAWNSFSSTTNTIPSTLKNLSVSTDTTSSVPLTVNGISGQTANLQEWVSGAGSGVASLTNAGTLTVQTLNLTNDLTVANGGTGASTFTTGAYLKGNGTSAIQAQTGVPLADVTVINIPAAADLNTYTTQGLYQQLANANAAGGTNYPVAFAGFLEVHESTDDNFIYQRYTAYKDQHEMYIRARYAGTWNAWQKVPSGTVTVSEGGTGATTLTSGAYLKGQGTSTITAQTGIPAGDINSGTLSEARLPSGTVIQSVFYTYSTYTTGTGTTYVDIHSGTRPAITAKRSDSRFIVLASMNWLQEGTRRQVLRMLRNGSVVGQEQIFATAIGSGWTTANMFFQWHDTTARTAGTTYTFSFQSAVSAGTWYYNYNFGGLNGVSTYTILEVVN
jgi:hypothetical protein